MREVIPIMWLLNEAHEMGIPVTYQKPSVKCKVFEDNAGAIEIANVPKTGERPDDETKSKWVRMLG